MEIWKNKEGLLDDDSFLIEERANQRNLYKIKLEKKTKSIDEKWDSGAVRYKSKIVSPFHFFFPFGNYTQ